MLRKETVANPSNCVTRQLCRAKVRPLLGSSGSGFFSLGSAAAYYVWHIMYLLTRCKGDKTWANGVKLSRTYGIIWKSTPKSTEDGDYIAHIPL